MLGLDNNYIIKYSTKTLDGQLEIVVNQGYLVLRILCWRILLEAYLINHLSGRGLPVRLEESFLYRDEVTSPRR